MYAAVIARALARKVSRFFDQSTPGVLNMAPSDASVCMACGANAGLSQCVYCVTRLVDKGIKTAICDTCIKDTTAVDSVETILSSGSATTPDVQCRPCLIAEKRIQEAALMSAVAGPSPQEILQTVAATAPWFLVLRRTTDEDKTAALIKVKTKLDFNSTAQELGPGDLGGLEPVRIPRRAPSGGRRPDPPCERDHGRVSV